ncbi:DUF6602 domain-containing protein [Pseudomonas sp. Irchel s3h14]|uniref:DUF6602 domain-containing protein n=1 Tax=Pseudomonas sp. Irchel s3h14 TaxID=2009179 RepID=UPI000BA48E78|nr:DUF6602 domain-containing protein [Pseudomonas sp. Irchel s3h14]
MIRKASELLEQFIKAETRKLDGVKMPHMPTLGSAYEEITKQGIYQDFAIPKNLDLRVVSGFISVGGEMLNEQIDCMLVHGEGVKYGLTDQYIYDIDKVLCVFEVKKTLRRSDFVDAIQHLAKIRKKLSSNLEERVSLGYEPDITAARKRFSQVTGNIAPEKISGSWSLSGEDAMLFSALIQESLAPITIIHGYSGYKKEGGLRTAFADILEDEWKKGKGGLGVLELPTLVTSNEYCLVKGNGTPFLVVQNDDEWVAVLSTRHNSAKLILELIWTKISNYFGVEMPWDDGLHMDNAHPLIIAKAIVREDAVGWEYITVEPKEKDLVRDDDNVWVPSELGRAEITAINLMVMRGGYLALDQGMNNYLIEKHGVTVDQVAENLVFTRQFMRDGNNIRPIHRQTYVITNEDETGFVASEVGRFDLWCREKGIAPHYLQIYFMGE